MPDYAEVTAYLAEHQLEQHLSDVVAACVEAGSPQPLARIAEVLAERAASAAISFDVRALRTEINQLLQAQHTLAPVLVQLSWHDAAKYSAALGGGRANAALRLVVGTEAAKASNANFAEAVAQLAPIKARYPMISHADLWAFAANVAVEFMGGPVINTRFGRRDAASSTESVAEDEGRLPRPDGDAAHLRQIFRAKGLGDREIVVLAGRQTVGVCDPSSGFDGQWTESPLQFDNSFFSDLLGKQWKPKPAEGSGKLQMVSEEEGKTSTTIMLVDHALLTDEGFRAHVERYAADQHRFFADFAAAWSKVQELGYHGLKHHPDALEYASSCCIPTDWIDLTLVRREEYNHDTTRYAFELPFGKSLDLPVCSCLLLKAPGADGTDAVRPYTPISGNNEEGICELLVKRYDLGAVSQFLYKLPLGASVPFRHIQFNIKTQYPFEGKRNISMVCAGTGITPMFQALTKIMSNPADERNVVLLYGNKSVEDILLKDEIDAYAKAHPKRLKVIHVVGNRPTDPPPKGWESTSTYIAESGWIDDNKISKYCFPPANDTLLFVCGLPPMYNALCGPRDDKAVREGSVLHLLGYTSDMVAKM